MLRKTTQQIVESVLVCYSWGICTRLLKLNFFQLIFHNFERIFFCEQIIWDMKKNLSPFCSNCGIGRNFFHIPPSRSYPFRWTVLYSDLANQSMTSLFYFSNLINLVSICILKNKDNLLQNKIKWSLHASALSVSYIFFRSMPLSIKPCLITYII